MSFHAGQTFTFGEQPSATKWQYLWDNDYALADGTGISNDAIINRHLADDSVTGDNLSLDYVFAKNASNVNVTSATLIDSGLKVTLPAAGTWLLFCDLRSLSSSSGQYIRSRLYNQTTSTAITDSERLGSYNSAGGSEREVGSTVMRVVTTTTNNIIRLEIASGGAYTSTLESDTQGWSTILAVRIG